MVRGAVWGLRGGGLSRRHGQSLWQQPWGALPVCRGSRGPGTGRHAWGQGRADVPTRRRCDITDLVRCVGRLCYWCATEGMVPSVWAARLQSSRGVLAHQRWCWHSVQLAARLWPRMAVRVGTWPPCKRVAVHGIALKVLVRQGKARELKAGGVLLGLFAFLSAFLSGPSVHAFMHRASGGSVLRGWNCQTSCFPLGSRRGTPTPFTASSFLACRRADASPLAPTPPLSALQDTNFMSARGLMTAVTDKFRMVGRANDSSSGRRRRRPFDGDIDQAWYRGALFAARACQRQLVTPKSAAQRCSGAHDLTRGQQLTWSLGDILVLYRVYLVVGRR